MNKFTGQEGKISTSLLVVSIIVVAFFFAFAMRSIMTTDSNPSVSMNTSTTTTAISTTTQSLPDVLESENVTAPQPNQNGGNGSSNAGVPTKPPRSTGHAIGIAGGSGLSKLSEAELNRQLDQMVELGVTWVRFDIEWGNVQYSSPNNSTWKRYDTLVDAIAAHHLNGLGVILFTPEWARDPNCKGGAKCPPKDPSTYAKFAAEVAARYKGKGIHAWEIWNEQNSYDFWATQTDCHAYTALLKVTYPAIKNVDPTATIITGGVAPLATDKHNISQIDFLKCIYQDGGKNYFDAVGDHPYTFPALPSSSDTNAWARMSKTSPSLRSLMVENGDSHKKIWMTEFGVPTDGPDPKWHVDEKGQDQTVIDTIQLYKAYSWAGPLFWYSLKDAGTTKDTNEHFFGLTHNDGTPKPAFNTLKSLISAGL